MRCTVGAESRACLAMVRTVQWVPSFGWVARVLRTKWATFSSETERGRPGRNSSCSPRNPCLRKRWRHMETDCWLRSSLSAMALFAIPSAAKSTRRARITNPCGNERDLATAFNCNRSSSASTSGAFGRPVTMGFLQHNRMIPRYMRLLTYSSYL